MLSGQARLTTDAARGWMADLECADYWPGTRHHLQRTNADRVAPLFMCLASSSLHCSHRLPVICRGPRRTRVIAGGGQRLAFEAGKRWAWPIKVNQGTREAWRV